MKFWNKRLKNSKAYIPGEQPGDLDSYIKLNTNENPFPPSKAVIDSMQKACMEKLNRYPDPVGQEIREAVAKKYAIGTDNIFVANGSDEIFTLIFRGFIEQNQLALFPYPSYSLYNTLAEINGIKFETVELDKNFNYNLDAFLKKKSELVIIASPNNPTGTYCDVKQIEKFLSKYKGLLVVDEAYIDFYGGSAIDLVNKFDNLIVTRSFSKSYSLAGLRVGLAIANKDIIAGFLKIKDSYNIDRIAIAGAKAALLDTKAFNYNITMVQNNKEYLEEYLESFGFEIIPSRANFVFVKHNAIASEELYQQLKKQKILIRFFSGPRQSEYVRITVGTMQDIKALCKALTSIIGDE